MAKIKNIRRSRIGMFNDRRSIPRFRYNVNGHFKVEVISTALYIVHKITKCEVHNMLPYSGKRSTRQSLQRDLCCLCYYTLRFYNEKNKQTQGQPTFPCNSLFPFGKAPPKQSLLGNKAAKTRNARRETTTWLFILLEQRSW